MNLHNFSSGSQVPVWRAGTQAYGVRLTYAGKKTALHYTLECRLEVDKEAVQLTLNRKEFFINGAPPEGKVYRLAHMLAAAFYPVVLVQNTQMKTAQIANYKDLAQRCREVETQVQQQFGGAVVADCLAAFKRALGNPHTIMRALEEDFLFGLLFFQIPCNNSPGETAFTMGPPPGNRFIISPTGARANAEGTTQTKDFAGTTPNGEKHLTLSYCLYGKTPLVKAVTGLLRYKDEWGQPEELTIELYHLNPENIPLSQAVLPAGGAAISKEPSLIVSVEEVPPEKKAGGWSALFDF